MKRPRPYDKTTHDGKTVDWLTKAALMKAERRLGYSLSLTQGSYQADDGTANDVAASSTTHHGGGVVDCPEFEAERKMRALRACGFWAWVRPELIRDGRRVWSKHVHAVQEGNRKLSASAFNQVIAGKAGFNGLADRGPDPHADVPVIPFRWPYYGPVGRLRWVRDNLTGRARRRLNRQIDKLAAER
jgi:hypothetical protein